METVNVIKVQKIPQKKIPPSDVIAKFCYHYQQYTFAQARKLPYNRIQQMLKVATQEQAKIMITLVEVVSAPHAKDGGRSLRENLNAIINE